MRFTFKRTDLERVLIAGAAALVLLLAARGVWPTKTVDAYEVPYDQVLPDAEASAPYAGPTQSTIVYYQDGDGYLVPVMREVPQTEGIAKATLALMVANTVNDMEAARLGLRTVIPEGTTFELDIHDRKARVDLSANVLNALDAEQENCMVSAIVQTLAEFDSVDEVEFLIGGQKRSKLTHGTDVASTFSGGIVNLESVSAGLDMTGADQVQLYFPSETGRLLIPVTRTVFSTKDIDTAVLELAKGPRKESGLQHSLPQGCGLIDVKVENGVATINFTKEFTQITEQSDGGQQAVRALMLTCRQFPGVKQVKLLVEGAPYTLPEQADAPTFANVAAEVVEQFPGVMEFD